MIYWAIYENPIPDNIEKFILDMAKRYENRFGKQPNLCKINPLFPEISNKIENISIIRDKYIPNFQFWFSEVKIDVS